MNSPLECFTVGNKPFPCGNFKGSTGSLSGILVYDGDPFFAITTAQEDLGRYLGGFSLPLTD